MINTFKTWKYTAFAGVALAAALACLPTAAVGAEEPKPEPPKTEPKPATPPAPPQAVAPQPAPPAAPKAEASNPPAEAPNDPALTSANPLYLADLAQVHINYNFPDRAETYARKASEALKGDATPQTKVRVLMLLAQVLDRKNDTAGATQAYTSAMEAMTDPMQRVQILLALAEIKSKAKDSEGSAKQLADAMAAVLQINGNNKEYMIREIRRRELELARQDPARLTKVIADAEAALAKDSKDLVALERLSDIYTSVKPDPQKALPVQEALVQAQPKSVEALSRLSLLYQQNKQSDKALETSKKLIEIAPKEQKSYYEFQAASQIIQSGQKDAGIKFMEEAIGATPSGHDMSLMASVYEQAGDMERAAQTMTKAIEQPNLQPVEKTTMQLRTADILRRKKDYASAETLARGVMKDASVQKNLQDYAKSILVQINKEQGKEFKE